MDDHLTISTFQLFKMFPDQETARAYLESHRWPEGVKCPVCGLGERITVRGGGFYRCNQCREDFTVRTGTIFERSHVPLHKWMRALTIVAVEGSMPTSTRLAKDAKLRQPTAWAMLKRLKPALDA